MGLALILALSLVRLPVAAATAAAEEPAPSGLMCELLAIPERTRITNPRPRFGWIVNARGKNEVQSACQIRVAESAAGLERESDCLWDSGRIASDQSVAVAYAGSRPLESDRSYWWRVRTWNRKKVVSAWSEAQEFRTGTLRAAGAAAADRFTVARYPLDQTERPPASVVKIGDGHYFLDFGRAAFGALRLTAPDSWAGSALIVHLGEARDGQQRVHRKPGGAIRYHRAQMTLTPGVRTHTVPLGKNDARRMPPEIGPVMPFRYVEIENCPAPLTTAMARQVIAHYPFNDAAARFTSSDRVLNDVWELCRYSIKATSFCGLYVDGDRERLPYEADAFINQLGHYAVDREFTLARYSHEFLMLQPTWPTEWILHSVLMAWADYLHTGDTDSLTAFYDDLKAKTLSALAREDGLISTVQPPVPGAVLAAIHSPQKIRDIVDWPPGERDGYDMRPLNTVVNAFHYRAMILMAEIAKAVQRPEDAAAFSRGASRVAESFNARLFDGKTGLYVDGENSAHSSLHANMFALAFGLAPPERVAAVAAFVRGKGMACSVYGAQFLLEALYRAGQADHALALMTARNERSWAHMLYDVGSTITLEAWDNRFKPNQDWNHAWGAAPANIIPRLLMGVEPIELGFRKIRIRPQPGGLQKASLDLPTIRGPVHVDFDDAPGRFVLNIRLPANTTGQVFLPRLGSDDATVTVDGVRRKARVEGNFLVLDSVGSGAHSLVRAVKK